MADDNEPQNPLTYEMLRDLVERLKAAYPPAPETICVSPEEYEFMVSRYGTTVEKAGDE